MCVCVCVWIESEREGTCFINPSKSSLERRHSLPKPSVMRSSGVSVPRTEIITDLRWCRTTTKYSLLAILWFLVKNFYLRFYDFTIRFYDLSLYYMFRVVSKKRFWQPWLEFYMLMCLFYYVRYQVLRSPFF